MAIPSIHGASVTSDFWFRASKNGKDFRVIISQDFLDDKLGDKATVSARHEWIKQNLDCLQNVFEAYLNCGVINSEFTRIVVKEE